MGQPPSARFVLGFSLVAALVWISLSPGCRRGRQSPPARAAAGPRVASITPAGTDLLIAVGGADHLVGVSNFDDPREGYGDLPRIGDYRSIDWEKLLPLRPQVLVIQHATDRLDPAIRDRCDQLHIDVLNLQLNDLVDILRGMLELGHRIGMPEQAQAAARRLTDRLNNVKSRQSGLPRVNTLIVTDDSGMAVAGPGTFLDDLLTIAGGANAAASLGKPYAMVDRETLMKFAPEAVIQLIPDGDRKPQVLAAARDFWNQLPALPAVRNHRVYILTPWYALEPGSHVGELAEKFAEALHPAPNPTAAPTSRPAGVRPAGVRP